METKLFLTCMSYSALCCSCFVNLFINKTSFRCNSKQQQLNNRCIPCTSIKDCFGKQSGQSEEWARNRLAHKDEKASLKKAKENLNKVLLPRFARYPSLLDLSFSLSLGSHTHTHTHTHTLSLSLSLKFSLSGGSTPG